MDENEQGHPTLENLKELKAKFADPAWKEDIDVINSWEKEVKELIIREKLCENKALREIVKKFADDVTDMNTLLMNADSGTLSDEQRDRVLDRKKLYKDFIALFDPEEVRKSLEGVDKEVKANLKHVKRGV